MAEGLTLAEGQGKPDEYMFREAIVSFQNVGATLACLPAGRSADKRLPAFGQGQALPLPRIIEKMQAIQQIKTALG